MQWGTFGFLSPSITRNRQAFLYQHGVVFPMGAVSIFWLINPMFLWNAWLFLLHWDPNTTQSHCPCSLEGNIGRAALSSLSGCDTQGLYDLNWIILRTLNILQAGQIFPLTGASYCVPWAWPLYWAQEPAAEDKSTRIPILPLLTLWQPNSIHSIFICA